MLHSPKRASHLPAPRLGIAPLDAPFNRLPHLVLLHCGLAHQSQHEQTRGWWHLMVFATAKVAHRCCNLIVIVRLQAEGEEDTRAR